MAEGKNSYEAGVSRREGERLAALDAINTTSHEWTAGVIGDLHPGQIVFDLGAGESTALRNYVRSYPGAIYIAQDVRPEAGAAHEGGDHLTTFIHGDVREGLILPPDSLDVAHARYLLAFFDEETRRRIIGQLYEATAPGGRMVVTDYDWRVVTGSEDIERLRDLGLAIDLFTADYGAVSAAEIADVVPDDAGVAAARLQFEPLTDYEPLLKLRPVITSGLLNETDGERLSAQASELFDRLEAEAQRPDRPAYLWPDAVTVIVTKPERQ